MTNTIGRVQFTASLDGKGMNRDAERVGRQAGAAAGDGYDAEWSKRFKDSLSENGRKALAAWEKQGRNDGYVYGKALDSRLKSFLATSMKNFEGLRLDAGFLDDWNAKFDDAGLAAGELQRQLVTLRDENLINASSFRAAQQQVDEWAESQRSAAVEAQRQVDAQADLGRVIREQANMRAVDLAAERDATAERINLSVRETLTRDRALASYAERLQEISATRDRDISGWRRWTADIAGGLVDVDAHLEGAGKSVDAFGLKWRDLSHNTRQWTLIIGAVMAAMQDLAVLGSAAGAGLVAVGGAATSGIIGIGGLAAVFKTLSMEVEDLPPGLRKVAQEFRDFTPVFGELRQAVSVGAFAEMEGVFTRLRGNLSSLTPELAHLGTSVGRVFSEFAEGTRPGSAALEEIRRSIQLAGGNFEDLAGAAGTWGVALLRSFNRAQPLVEDLIGYIDLLGQRFDAFTQSDGFDVWIGNAQRTFGALGPLLDATGRALNDLVTPAAVERTAAFMENLTAFMPNLSRLLDILGQLDVFGLAAQLLNEFGAALEPLAGPVGELATAVSGALSIAITQAAEAVGVLATAIAPTVQALADFVGAIPPDVLAGIANGLIAIAVAFGVVKGAVALNGVITGLSGLTLWANSSSTAVQGLGGKLGSALGKAGMVGLAVAGVGILSGGLEALYRQVRDIDNVSRNFVASGAAIGTAYDELGRSAFGALPALTDTSGALDMLPQVGTGVLDVLPTIAATFSDTGRQASSLAATLTELDKPLADLARTNLPEATSQFAAYAEQLGATDAQTLNMINETTGFKQVLLDQLGVMQVAATDANLLALAMGEIGPGATSSSDSMMSLGGVAISTGISIEDLANKIRGFAETAYSSRDAAREYEAAIDGLTASVAENGATLDITTEAGRRNEAAVDALAGAVLEHAAATLENTKDQGAANDVIAKGRDELIRQLGAFGITGAAADEYANKLGLIPKSVTTIIEANTQAAQSGIDGFISRNNGRRITIFTTNQITGGPANMGTGGYNQGPSLYAAGTIAYGPTAGIFGEAGPEAVVPLDRPLSQVDESVRWLSAIAQGKASPTAMASGGIAGAPQVINHWEPGSIVVQGADDPEATGAAVLDAIARRTNG